MSAVRTVRLGGSPVRVVQVVGGAPGTSLDFEWDGTQLGVRIGDSGPFTYVDLQGDTGKSLEFTWSGTQLGVRVEGDASYTYVDLQGEPGDVGPAGAQVGGSAPVDTSVLWIDTSDGGDTGGGGASAFEYWGPGRPDIAGTLDTAGTAWVAAATQGAVFHSTTGDQGAQVWTLTAGGWVVTVGDTGWRSVGAWLVDPDNSNGAVTITSGYFEAKRVVGGIVYIRAFKLILSADFAFIPTAGFRPGTRAGDGLFTVIEWNSNTVRERGSDGATQRIYYVGSTANVIAAGKRSDFNEYYHTTDAWPTALPGTPV